MTTLRAIATLILCATAVLEAETRALLVPLHQPVFAPQIDLVRTSLERAQEQGLGHVFLEIDIAEGEPLHGKDLAEAIADAPKLKVVAYIRDEAYAAGALVALGSSEIVMRRGATLGNAGLSEKDERRLSPLRAALSSYARHRGYPRRLAEAMADPDLEVLEVKATDGPRYYTTEEYQALSEEQRKEQRVQRTVVARGQILTLDADEAVVTGFARKVVSGRDELFALYGLTAEQVEVVREPAKPDGKEKAPATPPDETGEPGKPSETPVKTGAGKRVAVIPVNDGGSMIDMALAGFIRRQIDRAKKRKVDLIIFEIETWGGRVDSADRIADYIAGTAPIPTVAVVRRAISAGAMISISCESIYMLAGTNIGSTLPVDLAGNPGGRKIISAVKKKMKALAEKNSYPYRLVEPMVDPEIELVECRLDGQRRLLYRDEVQQERDQAERERRHFEELKVVCRKGDIFNLTAEEAVEYGLSKGTLKTFDELWSILGYERPTIYRSQMNWPEKLARFVSSPYICGAVMALGVIALIIEFITPGFGVGGTLGLLLLGLALWSQYMVESANALEILLFLFGFALIVVEVLAMPGFGAVGVLGGVLVLVSLLLAYIPDASYLDSAIGESGWGDTPWRRALLAFGISFGGIVAGIFVLRKSLSSAGLKRRLTVQAEVQTDIPGAPTEEEEARLVGRSGKALTPLRPAGTAVIDGQMFDVTTDGGFIEAEERVQIIRIEGNKIVVRPARG